MSNTNNNTDSSVELSKQSELLKSMSSLKLRRLKRIRYMNEDRYVYGSRSRKGFNFAAWYKNMSENNSIGMSTHGDNSDKLEKSLQKQLEVKEEAYRSFLISRYPLSPERVESLLEQWRDSLFPKNRIKELDENRVNLRSGSYLRRQRKSSQKI